jgi:hypothetical protein
LKNWKNPNSSNIFKFFFIFIFRKTPTPSSPVQEKNKGKKQTKWEADGPENLDYGNKDSGDDKKIDDFVSSQYATVNLIFRFEFI